jgi:hypothetical protein
MQPILAESSHRSRAVAFAVVLTVATSLVAAVALVPRPQARHARHFQHGGKCPYVYVVR